MRDIDYIVDRRNLIEDIFDLELKDPIVKGYFYTGEIEKKQKSQHGLEFKKKNFFLLSDAETSYEKVLFSGNERTLFVFELLVFLIVDFFAQNYVLAAFIEFLVYKVSRKQALTISSPGWFILTFFFMKIIKTLREDLSKRNLSVKTLVDKRFLI